MSDDKDLAERLKVTETLLRISDEKLVKAESALDEYQEKYSRVVAGCETLRRDLQNSYTWQGVKNDRIQKRDTAIKWLLLPYLVFAIYLAILFAIYIFEHVTLSWDS